MAKYNLSEMQEKINLRLQEAIQQFKKDIENGNKHSKHQMQDYQNV